MGGENFIVRSLTRKAINVVPERYISNGKRLPKGQRAYMVNYVSAGGFNSMVVVTFGRLSTFMCKGSYIKNICL